MAELMCCAVLLSNIRFTLLHIPCLKYFVNSIFSIVMKKTPGDRVPFEGCYFVFGLTASRDGRTRTGDLLGMSQASSQLLHIAIPAAGVAVAAAYKVREDHQ